MPVTTDDTCAPDTRAPDGVAVLWTPLGADGPAVVRASGRAFEALSAAHDRRRRLSLFHAALEIRLDGEVVVAEMTPVWGQPSGDRGVLAEGPVGARVLGRSRFFRYEVRCRPWSGPGPLVLPASTTRSPVPPPRRVAGSDPGRHGPAPAPIDHGADGAAAGHSGRRCAHDVLEAAADVPLLIWGRRAPGTGEMWNSNSVVAWLLARAGVDALHVRPPEGGRAPGWHAGIARATR